MFGWLIFAAFCVLLAWLLGVQPRIVQVALGIIVLLLLLALLGVFGARAT